MSSHFSQVKDDEQSHACVIRRRSERKRKKFHIYLHISKLTNDALSFIHSFIHSSSSAAAAAAHKGPTIGMVNSLKTALDVFGGQEEQSVQVLLNVDSGANLTKILTDNEGLLSSAAQLREAGMLYNRFTDCIQVGCRSPMQGSSAPQILGNS